MQTLWQLHKVILKSELLTQSIRQTFWLHLSTATQPLAECWDLSSQPPTLEHTCSSRTAISVCWNGWKVGCCHRLAATVNSIKPHFGQRGSGSCRLQCSPCLCRCVCWNAATYDALELAYGEWNLVASLAKPRHDSIMWYKFDYVCVFVPPWCGNLLLHRPLSSLAQRNWTPTTSWPCEFHFCRHCWTICMCVLLKLGDGREFPTI